MDGLITASVDIAPLISQLKNAHAFTGGDMKELIVQQATLFVYNGTRQDGVINLLPPLSGGNKGKAGLQAGQAKIDSDLAKIFAPRVLKGQRVLPHLFGDTSPDTGHKPPYIIQTKEKWPDVGGIYKQRSHNRRGKNMTRGQKSAYYVDKAKLDALRKELHARVGWAAACWYAAAIAAGLSPRGVPAWIKRHSGAPGSASISVSDTSFSISLTSSLNYNGALDVEYKARKALEYRENAIRLRLPYLIKAALKKANLEAA